jgi:UDP-N-acetylglucosamine 4,6-dehydratase
MDYFDGSSILVTGGTGSFGKELINHLLLKSKASRIVVFSRDELKQHEMRQKFSNDFRLRFFIGDVRDLDRLKRAFCGIDYVVHAAALKQVDTGEYNPLEFVKTNVYGSQNVIEASIDAGVKKVVALSTDKASSPINLYGATKLTADKLFVAANNYSQKYGTQLSVVRYGNVMGSRGSVIPLFQDFVKAGKPIPITDTRMTRFWITLPHAARFVLETFSLMTGGELYVPKIPSMKILDLAKAISPTSEIEEIGIRPGEKLHEEMISEDDSRRTLLIGDRYLVKPVVAEWGYIEPKGELMLEGFSYKSDTNTQWMSVEDIKVFISADS